MTLLKTKSSKKAIKFVAIGASLGGMQALKLLLAQLPDNFKIPIGVVLHRQWSPDDYLISTLQKNCKLKVIEADDKMPILPATVTMAPANYHLLIDNGHYSLNVDDPVNMARPSVDVLFESVADYFGESALAIILTGSGFDGAAGTAVIKSCGGQILIEDPKTAESAEMPEAAIKLSASKSASNIIVPLSKISHQLVRLCQAIELAPESKPASKTSRVNNYVD